MNRLTFPHDCNTSLRIFRRLIDSTIFFETRTVTDENTKIGHSEGWGSIERMGNASSVRNNDAESLILASPVPVPCTYLWLRFFYFLSISLSLASPILARSASSPWHLPFACLREQGDHEEGTPTLSYSRVPTREAWIARYMCASTYVIFLWYPSVSQFKGGTGYRRGPRDAIKSGNCTGIWLAMTCLVSPCTFHSK